MCPEIFEFDTPAKIKTRKLVQLEMEPFYVGIQLTSFLESKNWCSTILHNATIKLLRLQNRVDVRIPSRKSKEPISIFQEFGPSYPLLMKIKESPQNLVHSKYHEATSYGNASSSIRIDLGFIPRPNDYITIAVFFSQWAWQHVLSGQQQMITSNV